MPLNWNEIYNPSKYVDYTGPYPIQDLARARGSIIDSLRYTGSAKLERLKQKLGLNSDATIQHLPEDQQNGQGENLATEPNAGPSSKMSSSESLPQRLVSDTGKDEESEITEKEDSPLVTLEQKEVAGSRMVVSPAGDEEGVITPRPALEVAPPISSSVTPQQVLDRSGMFDDTLEISEGVVLPVRRVMQPGYAQDTFLCFKCDFCDYHNPYGSQIEQHLHTAQHFSASSYRLCSQDGQVYPTALEKQLVFTNPAAKYAKEVAVCVKCSDVFEDIFMCATHSKYSHNFPGRGCYALCSVIFEEMVICGKEPKCTRCRFSAPKHNALHTHWKHQNHQPFRLAAVNTMMVCMCPYCEKFFYSNFIMAKMHVLDVHGKGAVRVRHILMPREAIEMPREHTVAKTVDALKSDKQNLYNMRAHFGKFPKSKVKKQEIRKSIRGIKEFQKHSGAM